MNNTEDLLSVYYRFLFIKLVDFVISRVDQKLCSFFAPVGVGEFKGVV